MTIELHASFKKSYKKRITPIRSLVIKTKNRIDMFKSNPRHPLLRIHPLTGSRHGQFAFSVTGDIRIIYQPISSDHVLFLDIGTHNQVYR